MDIVSGSRYLRRFPGDSDPPEQRRRINQIITEEVNRRLGLKLTDAFCGFKAYSVPALAKIELTETGYAMPLELWVRAAQLGLRIVELPVPLDLSRRETLVRRGARRCRHAAGRVSPGVGPGGGRRAFGRTFGRWAYPSRGEGLTRSNTAGKPAG